MAFHQCTHSAASWSTSMPALGSTVIWRTRSSVSLWQYQIQIVKEGIFAFWNQVLDSSFYVVIWSSSLLPKSVISIWTSKAKEHLLSFTPIVQVTIGSRIATTGDIIFICMKKIICRVIWILLWFFVVFLFFFSILCLRLSGVWIQDNFLPQRSINVCPFPLLSDVSLFLHWLQPPLQTVSPHTEWKVGARRDKRIWNGRLN